MAFSPRRTAIAVLIGTGALVALTACDASTSASDASATPSASPSPSEQETVPDVSAVPDDVSVATLESCAAIDTSAATVDGTTLGTCYTESLWATGSGSVVMSYNNGTQDGDFQVSPTLEVDLTRDDAGGTVHTIYVDGTAYQDDGSGWVKGDADSRDPDAVRIGKTAESVVALFAQQPLLQGIAECPVWNVSPNLSTTTLPDGSTIATRAFSCDGSRQIYSATVSDSQILFSEDWKPVSLQTAIAFGGMKTTISQTMYDFGKSVDIVAPD